MLSLATRLMVKNLLRMERYLTEVAQRAGVSLSSVQRIAKEPVIPHLDDALEHKRRGMGRPSKIEEFRPLVREILRTEPRIKSIEVFRRIRGQGYTGGVSTVNSLVATLRQEAATRSMRKKSTKRTGGE
jgi:hypothetical protein